MKNNLKREDPICSFTYGIAEKPYETGDWLAVDYEREEYYSAGQKKTAHLTYGVF